MLGALAASKAAKAAALCVCPIVGTAAITLSVPKVRDAVHRATAPKLAMASTKPRQYAKSRVRPARNQLAAAPICNDAAPVMLGARPFDTPSAVLPGMGGGQGALGDLREAALGGAAAGPLGGPVPVGGLSYPGGGGFVGFVPVAAEPTISPVVSPVPESETWIQMIGGFAAIGGTIRLAKRQPPPQPVNKPGA